MEVGADKRLMVRVAAVVMVTVTVVATAAAVAVVLTRRVGVEDLISLIVPSKRP